METKNSSSSQEMMSTRQAFWIGGLIICCCGSMTLLFGVPLVNDVLKSVKNQPVVDALQDAEIELLKSENAHAIDLLERLSTNLDKIVEDGKTDRDLLIGLTVKVSQLEVANND